MTRRRFIKFLGGGIVFLIGGTVIQFRAIGSKAQTTLALSYQAEILRFVLRWFVKVRSGSGPKIAALRKSVESIRWIMPSPAKNIKTIRVDAGGVTAFRLTRPESRHGYSIVYFHGGMYVFGSFFLYRNFMGRLAEATQAEVLWVDYRLAPEHTFPAAIEDAVVAYRWLLSNGADPRRIAIMGDSAGGGLAYATLFRLREEGVERPAAVVSLSPWADLTLTGKSLRENAEKDPMLNPEQLRYTAESYLAGTDPRNPYASPVYGDFTGLPRALIQVGGDEILLDDAVRLAEKTRAIDGYVELQIWPYMPHVWQLFATFLPEARRAIEQIGLFVRTAFDSAQNVTAHPADLGRQSTK